DKKMIHKSQYKFNLDTEDEILHNLIFNYNKIKEVNSISKRNDIITKVFNSFKSKIKNVIKRINKNKHPEFLLALPNINYQVIDLLDSYNIPLNIRWMDFIYVINSIKTNTKNVYSLIDIYYFTEYRKFSLFENNYLFSLYLISEYKIYDDILEYKNLNSNNYIFKVDNKQIKLLHHLVSNNKIIYINNQYNSIGFLIEKAINFNKLLGQLRKEGLVYTDDIYFYQDKNAKEFTYESVKYSIFFYPTVLINTIDDKCVKNNPIYKKVRSEEHTSELQSRENLVCRLLLEKKKKK